MRKAGGAGPRLLSTEGLAHASSRRPWTAIVAWFAILLAAAAGIVLLLGGALSTEGEVTADTESNRAYDVIHEAFPERREETERPVELVIVRSEERTADDAAFRSHVQQLVGELEAVEGVTAVETPLDGGDGAVSRDGAAVAFPVELATEDAIEGVLPVVEGADGRGGFDAEIYGEATVSKDFEELSQHDLKAGELKFGAPSALVILLLVFGAVVAALVPLTLAIGAIAVALGLTALIGQAYTFSFFVTNMIAGVGLALGVDYSLFVLSRYREERARGLDKLAAIDAAGATASRAVFFSGLAVAFGLLGMVLVPDSIMRSLGAGAILVAITSVAVALTLTPAVLSLLGDRVDGLRLPFAGRAAGAGAASEARFWNWLARVVMRRPAVSLVLSVAFLLACAAPLVDLQTGSSGVRTLPDRLPSKQGFLAFEEAFGGSTLDPALVVVQGGGDDRQAAEGRLERALSGDGRFGAPTSQESGGVTLVEVPVRGDPFDEEANAAVRDLREEIIPRAFAGTGATALVGGASAEEIDYVELTNRYLPIVFAFVLGLSFLLLMVAFRSLVVPVKAILLNLLSVAAAYGLLVLVFQKGVGARLFGVDRVDAIEAWVPLFLFSLLFGLSMDYHVFLLSRIRERFRETGDNTEAVAFGIGSTGRIITGAALIIVAVFVGFAMGDMVMFQHMGFGVAVALLLDATVIRSILVPASMKLLGEWNWYFPSWLEWLPEVHVEGGARPSAPPGALETRSG